MFRARSLALTAAALYAAFGLAPSVQASPCVAMDANFNLLLFGVNGKDWNAGSQDAWAGSSGSTEITTDGRPPFDSDNTDCYLAQFFNTIYVLNGDKSNPSAVYLFDAGKKSWSKQATNLNGLDMSSFKGVLDHDTNVFYGLAKDQVWFLNMNEQNAATGEAHDWTNVGAAGIKTDGYDPVMGLAQNHIHFLDVPGNKAGEASIFVIHFSYWQPEVQSYPVSGGGDSFPAQHGQVASFFQKEGGGVQQEFAYIPDDGSNTYVINVENNSTIILPGPSSKDPKASYFAGVNSLVQLGSSGALAYMPYTQGGTSKASWAPITNLASAGVPAGQPGGGSGDSSSAGAGASASGSHSASGTGAPAQTGAGHSSGSPSKSSGGTPAPSGSPGADSGALATRGSALAGVLGATSLALLGLMFA